MVRNMQEDSCLFGKQRNCVYATVSEASVMCPSINADWPDKPQWLRDPTWAWRDRSG